MWPTMLLFIIYTIIISFITFMAFNLIFKNKNSNKFIEQIPGPKSRYPFLGNLDLFWCKNVPLTQTIIKVLSALSTIYEKHGIFRFRLGPKDIICVFRHDTIESILTSNENINKSEEYKYLWDWLGKGLLTSTGSLWRSRRKLLTPTFHFKILEDFIPIFNEQSNVLVKVLREATDKEFIDIFDVIIPCTLDVICETAMGISIGAQSNKNQEYVKAIHSLGEILMHRIYSPWLWPDFLFYLTKKGKDFRSDLNILHGMTRRVINERKAELLSRKGNEENNGSEMEAEKTDNIYMNKKTKKRLAFLDLLLDYHIQNNSLSLEDIRQEVDTFMFEGHDTTGLSLSWTIYLLGLYPEVQIKIQEELDSIFGEEKNREINSEDIKRMNYIECVIKESLRVFPSVPFIGRDTSEELKIGEYTIPKGTTLFILINQLQLNPEIFDEPLKFKPERFEMDNISNRNPYAYVPFSAGPRGCIGKRFAMIEEKIILSKVLLNFNIRSLDQRDKIIAAGEMVYRPKCPVRVQIIPREVLNIKTKSK